MIAVTAFFDSFLKFRHRLDLRYSVITDKERRPSLSGAAIFPGNNFRSAVHNRDPALSAARDFTENGLQVQRWHDLLSREIADFLSRLEIAEISRADLAAIVRGGAEHYISHFFRRTAEAPEFAVWALLGEEAETQPTPSGLWAEVKLAEKRWGGSEHCLNSMPTAARPSVDQGNH